jgi:hypothetical protein
MTKKTTNCVRPLLETLEEVPYCQRPCMRGLRLRGTPELSDGGEGTAVAIRRALMPGGSVYRGDLRPLLLQHASECKTGSTLLPGAMSPVRDELSWYLVVMCSTWLLPGVSQWAAGPCYSSSRSRAAPERWSRGLTWWGCKESAKPRLVLSKVLVGLWQGGSGRVLQGLEPWWPS